MRHPYIITWIHCFCMNGWKACQIVDRTKWLNRISRFINFISPVFSKGIHFSSSSMEVNMKNLTWRFAQHLNFLTNFRFDSYSVSIIPLFSAFESFILGKLFDFNNSNHFWIFTTYSSKSLWIITRLHHDVTSNNDQQNSFFRSIPTTSTARLKCVVAENPKLFDFSAQLHILRSVWRHELITCSWSKKKACNLFQGREDDSLMILVLIYFNWQ